MKSRSTVIALTLFLLGSAAALYTSYRVGVARQVFEVTPLPEPVRVPILHEYYAGAATRVDHHGIRVDWSPVPAKSFRDSLAFDCIGQFRADETDCYLLQVGDRLIVERATFIQPFILLQDHIRTHGSLPDELSGIVTEPMLDRDALAEFLTRLVPGPEASEPSPPDPTGDEPGAGAR